MGHEREGGVFSTFEFSTSFCCALRTTDRHTVRLADGRRNAKCDTAVCLALSGIL